MLPGKLPGEIYFANVSSQIALYEPPTWPKLKPYFIPLIVSRKYFPDRMSTDYRHGDINSYRRVQRVVKLALCACLKSRISCDCAEEGT